MPERSQPLALALLLSCLLAMSTGCTSSRMMKDGKGFGWLGANKGDINLQNDSLDFPPPSSVEIPQRVSNQSINQARGIARIPGPAARSRTAPQQRALANPNHPMVQNGLYGDGSPTSPAIPTAVATNLPTPNPQFIDPAANPPAPVPPAPKSPPASATQLAGVTMDTPPTGDVHHERSIYEMESATPNQHAFAATYAEPVNFGAPPNDTSIAQAPTNSPVVPVSPAATEPSSGGTYYQSRTQQPRAWRPGSTSDLKTL